MCVRFCFITLYTHKRAERVIFCCLWSLRLFLAARRPAPVHFLQYDASQPQPLPQQGSTAHRPRAPTATETGRWARHSLLCYCCLSAKQLVNAAFITPIIKIYSLLSSRQPSLPLLQGSRGSPGRSKAPPTTCLPPPVLGKATASQWNSTKVRACVHITHDAPVSRLYNNTTISWAPLYNWHCPFAVYYLVVFYLTSGQQEGCGCMTWCVAEKQLEALTGRSTQKKDARALCFL